MAEDTVTYCTVQSDSSADAAGVVLLAAAEALVEVAVTKVVAGLEAADEADTEDEGAAEEEAELATLASTTAALPLAAAEEDEEESFPTPALVFKEATSPAEVAFHTLSAEPIASIGAVSVKEPKSPEPDRELI